MQIIQVIEQHPEYHAVLNDPEAAQQTDFPSDQNPFLHIGLHLSVLEQVKLDRPAGIRAAYQQLCAKYQDAHAVQHLLAETLAQCMWEAQQANTVPNEAAYLEKINLTIRALD